MSIIDFTSQKSKPIKIGLQLIYWLCILIGINLMMQLGDSPSVKYYLKWALVSFPFKFLIFYGYFYYAIPKWLYKRTGLLVLTTLVLFITYPLVKYQIDQWSGVESIQTVMLSMDDDETRLNENQASLIQEYSRRALTVIFNVLMAFFLRFTIDWFKNQRIRRQMETQQLKSELAMLRNQVNPHFLFNTLNNIDAMVYKVSAEASEAIMKLSEIMRYMLYESNVDMVPLKKEVDYLDSYFDLQKMRIKKRSALTFNCDIDNYQLQIAPMLFISFVENAFKHADFNDLFINCAITVRNNEIHFEVQNSVAEEAMEKDETGGIGLSNVKRRLALIYPNRHELKIEESEKTYKVSLKLTINED